MNPQVTALAALESVERSRSMAREWIFVHVATAQLVLNGAVRSTVNCDDIGQFFIAQFEQGLYHGEEYFYVAVFPEALWVVPQFTEGVSTFLRSVASPLERKRLLYRAVSPPRPFAWRRRLFGVLPVFPAPRLDVHPIDSIPEWKASGPFKPSEIPEFVEVCANVER